MQKNQTLLLVGYGRGGKDHAAQFLNRNSTFSYKGSTSWAALPYMAELQGICQQEAWEKRHDKRKFWKDECDKLRMEKGDELYLVRLLLKEGANVIPGIRGLAEITAAKRDPQFYIVWIDASGRGITEDPTVPYGPDVADEVWQNDWTPERFNQFLLSWSRLHGFGNPPQNLAVKGIASALGFGNEPK